MAASKNIEPLRVVKEQIPNNYEQYLKSVQEKNKRLRELRLEKDSEKRLKERQEQGFSVYFSGANKHRSHSTRSKIQKYDLTKLQDLEADVPVETDRNWPISERKAKTQSNDKGQSNSGEIRMKTAPYPRRGWGEGHKIKVKTNEGSLNVRAPDAYSEDFDSNDSSDEEVSEEEEVISSVTSQSIDKVTLSMNDVRQLRQSLLRCDLSQAIAEEMEHYDMSTDDKVSKEICDMIDEELSAMDNYSQSNDDKIILEFEKSAASISSVSENKSDSFDQKESVSDTTNSRINTIIEKMMALTASQQMKLLDVLTNIEQLTTEKKSCSTETDNHSIICIEILSNWGHPNEIGLTEIRLLDSEMQPISLESILNEQENISVLYNGKVETTRSSHMWKRKFSIGKSLKLFVRFSRDFVPSYLVIWNYNNTVQNLDVGVRECRIYFDGKLVFDNELEKGNGEHSVGYGICIELDKSNVFYPLSKSALNIPSTSPKLKSNDVAAIVDQSGDSVIKFSKSSRGKISKSTSDNLLSAATLHKSENSRFYSPRPVIVKANSPSPSKSSLSSQQSSVDVTVVSNKPTVDSRTKRSCSRDSLDEIQPLQSSSKSPRPQLINSKFSSESSVSKLQSSVQKEKVEHHNFDRDCEMPTSYSTDDECLLNKLKEVKIVRGEKLPIWLRDENKDNQKPHHVDSDHSDSDNKPRILTPMQQIQEARNKRRKTTELSLEESWSSLHLFNKSHAGRIFSEKDKALLNQSHSIDNPLGISQINHTAGETDPCEDQNVDINDENFVIPELPSGNFCEINILTTWGDFHYVGLTGIQIFSDTGELIKIEKIEADPSDINILPGYGRDPRVVTNLIDGVNMTRDDIHMWLTPYTPNSNHFIYLTFDKPHKIALIRFWNYNKSRIHSSRGAKNIEIKLNDQFIFKGEISRACGAITGESDAFGETILFTTDDNILEKVAINDDAFDVDLSSDDEDLESTRIQRPQTADTSESDDCAVGNQSRPFTSVKDKHTTSKCSSSANENPGVYSLHRLTLNFVATWGDQHYLGLCGFEILDEYGEAIPIALDMISANPRDMRVLPSCSHDDRTLDKLLDGFNVTTSDQHMWMIPFTEGDDHVITITFSKLVRVSGIRIWNYNKSLEDTYRGARILHVMADSNDISPSCGYLLRKAPGHCLYDYSQELLFVNNVIFFNTMKNLSSDSALPCGFVFQFNLFSAWSDQYYVGLNGIECYDRDGALISLNENNIAAYPDSVNILGRTSSDVRTPDKLIDGVNDTTDGRHMWLAPILPGILNKVFLIFDYPVALSMIRMWNYSKTPSRGVRDFSLLVDDLLIYSGSLPCVSSGVRGILPTCSGPQKHHSLLFDMSNEKLVRQEKLFLLKSEVQEQDVMLTNDCQIVTHYNKPQKSNDVDQQLRPMTSVPSGNSARSRKFEDKQRR